MLLVPWVQAGRGSGWVWGVIAMKKLGIGIALVLAAVVAVRMGVQGPAVEPGVAPGRSAGGGSGVELARTGGDGPVAEREEARAVLGAVERGLGRRVFPAERGRASVSGEVVDRFHRPLAGVPVEARPHVGPLPPGLFLEDDRVAIRRGTSDGQGRFRLEGVEEGPTLVEARFADGVHATRVVILAAAEEGADVRLVQPDPAAVRPGLRVLVVGDAGVAVPGAEVEVFSWSPGADPAALEAGRTRPAAGGRTDGDGLLALGPEGIQSGVVFAAAPDGRRGWARFNGHHDVASPLRVEVAQPGELRGMVLGASVEELAGASVALHALSHLNAYYEGAGRRIDLELSGSRFEAAGLAPGTYGVTWTSPRNLRLVVEAARIGEHELPNSVAMPEVTVESGRTVDLRLQVAPGGRIVGRVSSAGRAVPGARVRAVIAPRSSSFPAGFVLHGVHVWRLDGPHENGPKNPLSHRQTESDAEGRYELLGLEPGSYRLEVTACGLSFERGMDLEVREGETLELGHELPEAGVLQVAAHGLGYVGLIPGGEARPEFIAVVRDECATFPGLRPGLWSVARLHSDPRVAPVILGEAWVEAGRTTWLDLRERSVRARIGGVVLAGAAPVEDAIVRIHPGTARTDATGTFRITLGHAPHFGSGFGASIEVHYRGFEYSFRPEASGPVEHLDLVLDLGDHGLTVEVLEADGRAADARVEFELQAAEPGPAGLGSVRGSIPALAAAPLLWPLPAGTLQGRAILVDGLELPLVATLPQAGPLRLERPPTGSLRVLVQREGVPVPGARVTAWVWRGPGGEPATVEDFWQSGWSSHGRTDGGGWLGLVLPAGEALVSVHGSFLAPASHLRARIEAGGEARLTFEME